MRATRAARPGQALADVLAAAPGTNAETALGAVFETASGAASEAAIAGAVEEGRS